MNGVLIIDKPAGLTSHDVVARVRRITGERRVGHTGTLDPFATGVLVVLVGRATRLAQFLSGAEKEYEATIRLGYATDTGDLTGVRLPGSLSRAATEIQGEEVETAMASLRGDLEQTPPMYSAKKVGGRKLYELARRGEEVERQPVRITVSEFELNSKNGSVLEANNDGTTDLRVRVACSAGTYIRTLAEDFGKQLGVAAHLVELRRTRAGAFEIAGAITLDHLAELSESKIAESKMIASDAALAHLPSIELTADEVSRTIHGLDLSIDQQEGLNWQSGQAIRLRSAHHQLIAVGSFDESRSVVHPKVVIGGE
jgi:tRNA pseudouridine55 synthase